MPILIPSPQRAIQWVSSTQPGAYCFSSQKQTVATMTQNVLRLSPVYFHRSVTIDRLGCECTTLAASSTFRLGVYADNGNLYPGALLLDAGTVDTSTTGIKEVTVSLVIPQGVVWVGGVSQGGDPGMRAVSGSAPSPAPLAADVAASNAGVHQAGVSGALPAAFTTAVNRSYSPARLFWRIAP